MTGHRYSDTYLKQLAASIRARALLLRAEAGFDPNSDGLQRGDEEFIDKAALELLPSEIDYRIIAGDGARIDVKLLA